MEYVRNDQVLYTSRAEEFSYPLAVDSSFNNPSGRLEDIEWIGPGYVLPDYDFTLDSTLRVRGRACCLPAVASYVGGHAQWQVEALPLNRLRHRRHSFRRQLVGLWSGCATTLVQNCCSC